MNFHVAKRGDELHVDLTYPPYTDADNKNGKCRHVVVNQESVRASDGIRVWYDFDRDGFVVEQNSPYMREINETSSEQVDSWREVYFAKSWALTSEEFLADCSS